MIASFKKVYIRIFLGVSILAMGNTFASSFEEKVGDINVTATGGGKAIGHASHVTTDSLTQNQGGHGGSVTFNSPSREKTPWECYEEGMKYFRENHQDLAADYFLRAAGATEQHIKVKAYIQYAECVRGKNPSEALSHYELALKLEHRDEACRGLMELHYGAGKSSRREQAKQHHLQKAKEYGEKISIANESDESLLDDLDKKLAELNITGRSVAEVKLSELSLTERHPVKSDSLSSSSGKIGGDSSHIDDEDISTLSGGSGKGQSVEELVNHVVKNGNKGALRELTQLAEDNNIDALVALVKIYKSDDIFDADFEKVFEFASKAAEQGNAEAQFELAECYRLGKGTREDRKQANRYYKFASNQGHEGAESALKKELAEAKQRQEEEEKQRLLLQQQQREAETAAQRERIKQAEESTQQQKIGEERRQKELAEAQMQQQLTVSRPMSIPIPEIARGHEEIYRLFYNGKLIYKPDPNSDAGKIEFAIGSLLNPLEGTFDLSRCGDTGRYLSIHTGYKKRKTKEQKREIWFVPRFMVERELNSNSQHFLPIMDRWPAATAPIGIIWTWGRDYLKDYDYLTTQSPENLSSNNLYKKWSSRAHEPQSRPAELGHLPYIETIRRHPEMDNMQGKLGHGGGMGCSFYVNFLNKDEG